MCDGLTEHLVCGISLVTGECIGSVRVDKVRVDAQVGEGLDWIAVNGDSCIDDSELPRAWDGVECVRHCVVDGGVASFFQRDVRFGASEGVYLDAML